ncbi:acyltransferase family protein [Chenggangzhangella methanolivorans]|uniref:Acyltransferase n=1 Tax=Chenggangzhangella methanolivorans TaxID=1437009 RepID=A0A9E6UMB4_9HYPH|nr:acyltransferase [Chenggangzhangella methanolivorans]QZO01502.1 acyltransferase [Chenggangzhangella methanolivorans]
MRSIGERLEEHGGVGPGFDAVRIGLAFLILYIHCALLDPDPAREALPLFPYAPIARWALDFAVLPLFFALSGFLVAGSVERLPLNQFLTNRALRIFPALGVEIALSALILGPLLTSFALGAYFSDPAFLKYFLNILGLIHYQLPGVFLSNPQAGIVNGALWTVPHELTCYALLTALVLCGVYRRRWLLLAATVALFAVSIAVYLAPHLGLRLPGQDALTYLFVTRGAARLVPLFLVGLLIYRFRARSRARARSRRLRRSPMWRCRSSARPNGSPIRCSPPRPRRCSATSWSISACRGGSSSGSLRAATTPTGSISTATRCSRR